MRFDARELYAPNLLVLEMQIEHKFHAGVLTTSDQNVDKTIAMIPQAHVDRCPAIGSL